MHSEDATARRIAELEAALAAERDTRVATEVELSAAKARISVQDAHIQNLHLQIALAKQDKYGSCAERSAKLDQLEFQLEELETAATEDAVAADLAERAVDPSMPPRPRRHPVRKPFPAQLPRERVVVPAPASCTCCGSSRLSKLGEDITETLEVIPRRYKVSQTVREKFSCRDCEKITQPPAPFHVIP